MEHWNDRSRGRKTINLFVPLFIPIILLFQQSIIPILQKTTLKDNSFLKKIRKLQIY